MGRFRSGRRTETVEAGPSNQETQAEEVPQDMWQPVWVAIYEGAGAGAFKHWVIFVENEEDPSKSFICHV